MLLHYAKDPLAITHMAIRKCNCLRYTCRKSSSEWIWMGIFHYLRIHTLPKSSPNMMRNSRLSRHQVHRFSWDLKGGSIFWKQLDCNPTVKVRHKHEIDQIWSNSLGVFFLHSTTKSSALLVAKRPHCRPAWQFRTAQQSAQVLWGDVSRWSSHSKMGGFGIQTMAEMAEICGCQGCQHL
jgi:hypothetical protein